MPDIMFEEKVAMDEDSETAVVTITEQGARTLGEMAAYASQGSDESKDSLIRVVHTLTRLGGTVWRSGELELLLEGNITVGIVFDSAKKTWSSHS